MPISFEFMTKKLCGFLDSKHAKKYSTSSEKMAVIQWYVVSL